MNQKKLLYFNQGRGGTVLYKDDTSEIKFDFEFGGGNCVAIIFVPSPGQWASATKRSIDERDEILQFVASQATHDQVSGGYFKISDNWIEIFNG